MKIQFHENTPLETCWPFQFLCRSLKYYVWVQLLESSSKHLIRSFSFPSVHVGLKASTAGSGLFVLLARKLQQSIAFGNETMREREQQKSYCTLQYILE